MRNLILRKHFCISVCIIQSVNKTIWPLLFAPYKKTLVNITKLKKDFLILLINCGNTSMFACKKITR